LRGFITPLEFCRILQSRTAIFTASQKKSSLFCNFSTLWVHFEGYKYRRSTKGKTPKNVQKMGHFKENHYLCTN
jgi:hypothetical protein